MGVDEGNVQVMDRCRNDTVMENCPITTYLQRYFQHAHFIPIVGVGKRGAY